MTYQDVVEKLKISQEQIPDRNDRFAIFREAVESYQARNPLKAWPRKGENVVLVAGTNGKGTVSKTLETLLYENVSEAVGLFTSPHLMEPTERIRSHGRDLSEEEMVRAYSLVEPAIETFELSHFEILTMMMIEVFFGGRVRDVVKFAVIEVGVGGRLDPTRVVPHETAVVCRIGLDHEAILGSTVSLIAKEKLAIADGAKRLIFLRPSDDSDLVASFSEAKRNFSACEFFEAREFRSRIEFPDQTQFSKASEPTPMQLTISEPAASRIINPRWTIETAWGDAPLALLGERAVQNTSLALEVLHHCGFNIQPMLPSLAHVRWPGRMERLEFHGRDVYLSGDHNEQGVQSLVDLLSNFSYETLWLVVGVGKGKPIAQMLSLYNKIPRAKLILTRTRFRAIEMSLLFANSRDAVAVDENPIDALKRAIDLAGANDLIVISGSLYLIGDVRAEILRSRA